MSKSTVAVSQVTHREACGKRVWRLTPVDRGNASGFPHPGGSTVLIKHVMTNDPACCSPDTSLQEVARLMVEHDCGEIPVVDNEQSRRPVGVITDRDIVCRAIAEGRNPLALTAGECMTTAVVTVTPDMSIEDCCDVMERNQIRRVPVIDAQGCCCGIVSQADIARRVSERAAGEVVVDVSKPRGMTARAAGA
jgi:CBS domain-containing protein